MTGSGQAKSPNEMPPITSIKDLQDLAHRVGLWLIAASLGVTYGTERFSLQTKHSVSNQFELR